MRHLDTIIVHCTATRPDWWRSKSAKAKVNEIRRWHVAPKPDGRGWRDIGYHFLIDRDGTIQPGRPIGQTGAHVMGHNTGSIGVSLLGGRGAAADDAFEDHFTQEQDGALQALILHLRKDYGPLTLRGHNEFANKGCPGFSVSDWWASRQKPPAANWLQIIIAAIAALFLLWRKK